MLNQPVPELPVKDVERAQEYYRDIFGCTIEWTYPNKEIGAVSSQDGAIFFRRRTGTFEPVIHWVFADDIDARRDELAKAGAKIVDDIADKPWGLRQFTVEDLDGNIFHFHHEIAK